MELVEALDVATDEFRHRLAHVDEGQWRGPTPCEEWDVQYLVAHIVGGNRFAALVLEGASGGDAFGEIMAQRQLGDEPLADFTSSVVEQRRCFREGGASPNGMGFGLTPLDRVAPDAGARERLLDITGRDSRWRSTVTSQGLPEDDPK